MDMVSFVSFLKTSAPWVAIAPVGPPSPPNHHLKLFSTDPASTEPLATEVLLRLKPQFLVARQPVLNPGARGAVASQLENVLLTVFKISFKV